MIVASPLRRGRGSQPELRCSGADRVRGWRPLFGGDEDRNASAAAIAALSGWVASPLRRGRGSQPKLRDPGAGCARVASPLRRGRGSQPNVVGQLVRPLLWWRPLFGGDEDRNAAQVENVKARLGEWRPLFGGDEDRNGRCDGGVGCVVGVASPLRRGRGSQPHRRGQRQHSRQRWRPLFGGDEDRNITMPPQEGKSTRVASPLRRGRGSQPSPGRSVSASATPWRPLFGGDEDRNGGPASRWSRSSRWRPLFGGDEDRNKVKICSVVGIPPVASPLRRGRGSQLVQVVLDCPAGCLRGVPSSEGTRIATRQVWGRVRHLPVQWRPLFGGDEDRNGTRHDVAATPVGGVPSSEGTRIATRTVALRRSLGSRVASPLRRGRGSQLGRRHAGFVGGLLVASPLRRGRGSQRAGDRHRRHGPHRWRPLFGGDEDRNVFPSEDQDPFDVASPLRRGRGSQRR